MRTAQLQEADLTTQAQRAAAGLQSAAQTTWQAGSRGASDAFNRFVEGDGSSAGGARGPDNGHLAYGDDNGSAYKGDPARKDFWDSFAAAGEERMAQKQQQQQQQPRKTSVEPERKDFWDEFASIGEARAKAAQGAMFGAGAGGPAAAAKAKSSIGTAAMSKKTQSGPAGKAGDEWEDW